jgi:hypothetical protein
MVLITEKENCWAIFSRYSGSRFHSTLGKEELRENIQKISFDDYLHII